MPVLSGKYVLRKIPVLAPPASTVWLLQASTVVLQHSFHVQCLSAGSGRTVQLSCNGCLLWSPLHVCLPPLFGRYPCCIPASPPQCWAFGISLEVWKAWCWGWGHGDRVSAELEDLAVVVLSSSGGVLSSIPSAPFFTAAAAHTASLSSVVLATSRSL